MLRSNARARAARAAWVARAAALVCTWLIAAALPSGQAAPTDTTEPVVRITSPGEDDTVTGTVTIAAEATDENGVAGVIFEVDGAAIGAEDTAPPFSAAWESGASGAGAHILTAIARDVAGNAVRSDVVPVVVGATVPPPFPVPANHDPVAVTDSMTSAGRAPVTFPGQSLLANDTDPDGHTVSLVLVASSSSDGGTIANNGDGTWTYRPAATFAGVDTFTYSIADGFGGTASGTVNVNVTPPPPAGLVLALGFDENLGRTVFDASGGDRNGTIRGAERVSGRHGGALRFDGIDDWVTVADAAALDLTNGMTAEAWVQATALSGWESVVMKERGVGDFAYALYAHDGAPLADGVAAPAGYIRAGGTHQAVRGFTPLPMGAWTHLATTYDGTTQRQYVNGALVNSRPQPGPIAVSGGPLRIGGNASFSGEFFTGLIDDVRVYNRALSADEITADMNGSAPPPPPAPEPPPNRGPVAQNDTLSTTAGTPKSFTAASLLANDSDPDGDAISVSSVAATSTAGGSISGSAGSWTYTPAAGHSGADSFGYTIADGRGGSASATVNVTVNAPPSGAAGLVLALGFNEASGTTATDSSGGGRNGAIREATRVAGRFGGALSFDGANDWVTVPDSAALDLTGAMTIEAWVQPGAMNAWETVVLKERGVGDLAYGLYAQDGGSEPGGVIAPAGYVRAGGTHQAIQGAAPIGPAAWTHVAVTYDGATLRLYVNGLLASSRAQTGLIAVSAGALRIGGNNSFAGEFFQGLIDEVRVYNRALSAAEIGADMNAPIQ